MTAPIHLEAYILVIPPTTISPTYGKDGNEKKTWFIRLPTDIMAYDWGPGGEEGETIGRSVKSELVAFLRRFLALISLKAGRTLREVCSTRSAGWKVPDSELQLFEDWGEKEEAVPLSSAGTIAS